MAVITFLLSSAAVVAGTVALLLLHGGWQSADAGFTLVAAGGVVGSLLMFGIARDRSV